MKTLVLSLLLSVPCAAFAQTSGKKLVTVDGGSVYRAWLACVYEYAAQGISIRMAVEACMADHDLSIPESSIDVAGILGESTSVPTSACTGSTVDPWLAEDGGIPPAFDEMADSMFLDMQLAAACAKGKASACLALGMEQTEQSRIINGSKKGDGKGGGKDGGTHRISDQQVNACEIATTTIGECNRDGWKTSPCQLLLSNLKGCADPLIARTNPDEPQACEMKEIDAETVKRVTFLVCSKDKRPVGPDTNPCEPMNATGIAHSYRLPGNDENPLCSDPRALVQPEDCIHTIEIVDVGTDWETELREFQQIFGGPVVVFPGHGNNPSPPPGCKVCQP